MIDEKTLKLSLEALRAELITYTEIFVGQTVKMITESDGLDYEPDWDSFPGKHEEKAIDYVIDQMTGEEEEEKIPLRKVIVKGEEECET